MNAKAIRQVFDEAYYERFYRSARTRAETPEDALRRAAFITSYLAHIGLPVARVLDIGCGLGRTLAGVQTAYPMAHCTGVEVSDYLCEEYGWVKGSVLDFRAKEPFDLVICNDVIQYLEHADAQVAIDNLATLCQGALYFGALTREDWEESCDRARTDDEVCLRSTRWYRRQLRRDFVPIGGGLFLRRPEAVTLWSLERV